MNLHYVRVKSPPYKYVMSTVREYLFRKWLGIDFVRSPEFAIIRKGRSRQDFDEGIKQAAGWLKDEYYDL